MLSTQAGLSTASSSGARRPRALAETCGCVQLQHVTSVHGPGLMLEKRSTLGAGCSTVRMPRGHDCPRESKEVQGQLSHAASSHGVCSARWVLLDQAGSPHWRPVVRLVCHAMQAGMQLPDSMQI